jgi:hypothetical protein
MDCDSALNTIKKGPSDQITTTGKVILKINDNVQADKNES